CSGGCTDLDTDPRHCGACNSPTSNCAAGSSCCGGICKNLDSDNANCGACGRACGAGLSCCGGQCLNLTSDPNNCGTTCGNRTQCRAPNGTCCSGACINIQTDNFNCGRRTNACNTGVGQQCRTGTCRNPRHGDAHTWR